jgi:hypothetical protein
MANIQVEPTILKNIPFDDKANYSSSGVTEEVKRAKEVKQCAQVRIRMVPQLQQVPDNVLAQIETCVGKIIDRCFSNQIQRDFPMPRNTETVACACILIALSNMRQYQGSIQTWQIVDPEDKMAIKKVSRLKDRIERSDALDLFGSGIIAEASEVERLKSIMTRLCNTAEIPYKLTCKLVDRFVEVTKSVLMNGKNTFYLAAAVILHSLDGCKNFNGNNFTLTQDQIDGICLHLNLKRKSLTLYTKQLRNQCCSNNTHPPPHLQESRSSSTLAADKKED